MKLRYKGFLKQGTVRLSNGGSLDVRRGELYDIADKDADNLINSGLFEKVSNVKEIIKVEKKVEDVKKNEGGDKKW